MAMETLGDWTAHVGLFVCGALGYGLTKWANRRVGRPRLPPKKVLFEEEEEEAHQQEKAGEECAPCVPESEPAAVATPAARKVRRRASRQGKDVTAPMPAELVSFACFDADSRHAEEIQQPLPAAEVAPAEPAPADAPGAAEVPMSTVEKPVPAEVPPAVTERIARLQAKKAARKERRASEQRQLVQQLADAQVSPQPEAPPAADVTELVASAQSDVPEVGVVAVVDSAEPDSLEDVAESDPPATWNAEEPEAPALEKAMSQDSNFSMASTTDLCPPTPAAAADYGCHSPMDPSHLLGLLTGPPMSPSLVYPGEGFETFALQQKFTAIFSPDGQQLYTDGHEVYMMMAYTEAAPEVENGAAAAQLLHPITNPEDPLHQVARNLGVTGDFAMGVCADDAAPVFVAPASPSAAPLLDEPNPDVDVLGAIERGAEYERFGQIMKPQEPKDVDDVLWDICWEFIV